MKNADLNGEQKVGADDLRFMRLVIEKTHFTFPPGSLTMITLGLIFMIGYPATQHLLTKPQLYDFIQPMWIILWVIGASVSVFNGIRGEIRQRQVGLIPQLPNQICLMWYILLLNGTTWSGMGLFNIYFCELVFLWAIIFGFGLSIMGIM